MKVLLTGGAGFIGSHIAEALVREGFEVVIVDDLSTGSPQNCHEKVPLYAIDIASKSLSNVFRQERPDVVIHEAAQVSVPRSITNPVEDAMTNIIGTINLLECSKQYGVRRFVYASSCAVYGDTNKDVIVETDRTSPLSPYGYSKLTAEEYIQLYHQLYDMQYIILRYSNVYGPRQKLIGEGAVVPSFVSRMLTLQNPVIYGDGTQSRDFIYVKDVAKANLQAITAKDSGVFNISSDSATTIFDLYFRIKSVIGYQGMPLFEQARSGEIQHSCLDNQKARARLNWDREYGLEEGLTETVAYYER